MALLDFTEAERKLLEETIRKVMDARVNPTSASRGEDSWDIGEDHQAPETYVAKTPAGGIDALVDAGTGTGSTEPGRATCEIYEVEEDEDTGSPELVKVAELDELVYNISETAIDGDIFIIVVRSKGGKWLAEAGGGSAVDLRIGVISGICDENTDAGTATSTSPTDNGLYEVTLTKNTSLAVPTCGNTVLEFAEQLCCDIIDDETGNFTTCLGTEGTTGTATGQPATITGNCVDEILASDIGIADDTVITARDLSGRNLPVDTTVVVGKIGDIWVILEAGLDHKKVCLLSDIECATDCDGNNVFLRTFTPVWIPSWGVCDSQSEFIPICTGTVGM